jgi:putative tryptophan/tyrosine transport system substrate-binding protein
MSPTPATTLVLGPDHGSARQPGRETCRLDPLCRKAARPTTVIALVILALACATGGCSPRESPQVPVVGYVADANAEPDRLTAFRERLKELGYVEGRNIAIEFRLADRPEDYPKLVADLIKRPVDLLLAGNAAATRAARDLAPPVPIVMAAVNDPVGLGVVKSLARSGTNFTGTTNFVPQLEELRVQLLHELAPSVKTVSMPLNAQNPNNAAQFERLKTAAQALGIDARPLIMRTPEDVIGLLSAARASGTQAILPAVDNFINSQRTRIVQFVYENHLEAVYYDREWVQAGGLISLGPGHTEGYRVAAEYVHKVLQGETTADLPIATPTRLTVSASRSALARRGIDFPNGIARRIDEWLR